MIHENNADLMQCKMIVEGANNPTTFEADEILEDKGVYIVPDLMANAGVVTAPAFPGFDADAARLDRMKNQG